MQGYLPRIIFGAATSFKPIGGIDILSGGRFSLYGTFDCRIHSTAVDPTLLGGSSTSSLVGSCNSSACEPQFSDGYAPFGVVATQERRGLCSRPTLPGPTPCKAFRRARTCWSFFSATARVGQKK